MKKDFLILAGIGAGIYFLSKKKTEVSGIGYLPNYHAILVSYIGASNTKGSRISLKSYRFNDSIILNLDYKFNSIADQVEEFFEKKGIKILGKAEWKNNDYVFFIDKFESLKDIKKM
jgi:hypothetical protein